MELSKSPESFCGSSKTTSCAIELSNRTTQPRKSTCLTLNGYNHHDKEPQETSPRSTANPENTPAKQHQPDLPPPQNHTTTTTELHFKFEQKIAQISAVVVGGCARPRSTGSVARSGDNWFYPTAASSGGISWLRAHPIRPTVSRAPVVEASSSSAVTPNTACTPSTHARCFPARVSSRERTIGV